MVGTKVQLVNLSKEFASECEFPYILERWLGGIITNFNVIKKRVDHLKDLENKKAEGELDKYTKKERLEIDREIESLKKKFEGLKPLSKLPDEMCIRDRSNSDQAEKAQLETKLKEIEAAILKGERDLTLTQAEKERYQYEISTIKKRIDQLGSQIRQAEATVKVLTGQIKDCLLYTSRCV